MELGQDFDDDDGFIIKKNWNIEKGMKIGGLCKDRDWEYQRSVSFNLCTTVEVLLNSVKVDIVLIQEAKIVEVMEIPIRFIFPQRYAGG